MATLPLRPCLPRERALSLSLTDNRSYDLFAFQDRDDNGSYNAYLEPGDHYGDWNKSSQSFDLLIAVEGAPAPAFNST